MGINHSILSVLMLLFVPGCGESEGGGAEPVGSPISTTPPPPDEVENDGYLCRTARFDLIQDQVVVVDPRAPRMITMDPWPQMVFLSSDCQHSVSEFVEAVGREYEGGTPPGLHDQIVSIVNELQAEGIVEIRESTTTLPDYLAHPVSEQDPDRARQQMLEDGFIQEPSE